MIARTALAISLACIATAPSSAAPAPIAKQQALSPAAVAAVDAVVNEFVAKKLIPGAVVGVSRNGRILLVKGYGLADVEHAAPVTAETAFKTGSMGKQMTAASILLLAEQGKLSIDDPLSKYLPEVPRANEVTLRQLLNHTAGLYDFVGENFVGHNASRIERNKEELLRFILETDKLYIYEPGTSWDYSNTGFILLGAVIEKVSGESYAGFLKEHFFGPLGMKDTAVDDPSVIVPHRAEGYRRGKTPGTFKNVEFLAQGNFWSAGSLRSTAKDLLIWEDSLFGGKVLKPQSIAEMITPARLKDGRPATDTPEGKRMPFQYGLGSIAYEPVAGHRAMGNGGFIPGFNTWVRRLPDDDVTMVVMTNMTGQAREIAAKLVPAILGPRLNRDGLTRL